MSDVAISLEAVSKRFTRRGPRPNTLKQWFVHPLSQARRDRFWALQDINLEIRQGETVGLIGANGSGKSTLLRLIGGIGKPTRGRITRRRRVDAMLSLGDALDPMLTGRENAITAGILSGYRRSEVIAKLDEIIAFSELDEFFDHPLRTYSDGMKLRLAFSVAISVDPEVLLIDEVLSVGDVSFQEKCFARLEELQEAGTTILLTSTTRVRFGSCAAGLSGSPGDGGERREIRTRCSRPTRRPYGLRPSVARSRSKPSTGMRRTTRICRRTVSGRARSRSSASGSSRRRSAPRVRPDRCPCGSRSTWIRTSPSRSRSWASPPPSLGRRERAQSLDRG